MRVGRAMDLSAMIGVFAQATPGPPELWADGLTGWGVAFRIVAVLGLLVALATIARRWSGGLASRSFSRGGAMQVVDALPLGPQRGLYLVVIGERGVVVGVTPQTIQLVLELTPEEVRRMVDPVTGRAERGFLATLRAHMASRPSRESGTAVPTDSKGKDTP